MHEQLNWKLGHKSIDEEEAQHKNNGESMLIFSRIYYKLYLHY